MMGRFMILINYNKKKRTLLEYHGHFNKLSLESTIFTNGLKSKVKIRHNICLIIDW